MIGAGALRDRVAFEKRILSDDGYGNPESGDFVEQFEVLARVLPLKGSEAVLASRLAGRQPVVITVRLSPQTMMITPGWRARAVLTGAIYAITGAADMDGRRAFIDVLATAGEAA